MYFIFKRIKCQLYKFQYIVYHHRVWYSNRVIYREVNICFYCYLLILNYNSQMNFFSNIFKKFKEKFMLLLKINNSPRRIALGVAIGVFIGVTPLYGFHTIIVIIMAMLIPRTNKIAILIGSNISIPPTAPFISWMGYEIGRVILGYRYPAIRWITLKHFHYDDIKEILFPLFLGSFILGLILTVCSYFLILVLVRKFKGRRWKRKS